jgi:hypothetical protein
VLPCFVKGQKRLSCVRGPRCEVGLVVHLSHLAVSPGWQRVVGAISHCIFIGSGSTRGWFLVLSCIPHIRVIWLATEPLSCMQACIGLPSRAATLLYCLPMACCPVEQASHLIPLWHAALAGVIRGMLPWWAAVPFPRCKLTQPLVQQAPTCRKNKKRLLENAPPTDFTAMLVAAHSQGAAAASQRGTHSSCAPLRTR